MTETSETRTLAEIDRRGSVGLITMSDGDHLNPINTHPGGSEHQLAEAVLQLDRDRSIAVIVITGEGRAFSAGADFRPPSLGVYGGDGQIAAPSHR